MKLLIWLCLLGCLASVHGIFLDKITDRGDSSENGLLDGIFGSEDSDNSSHNKTVHKSPPKGILAPVELAAEVMYGIWDEFSKGVLGLLGSFTSGDDGGESPPTGSTASATTESTAPSQETTTTRITTATTTESRTESTVETTTTDSSTSTTPP